MNPFDYLNSINYTKKDIMVDDISESQYNSFMINRGLSYFPDTVLAANEMNLNSHIDQKLQYHFYINIIRKKKRFSKWSKKSSNENLQTIKEYYGYSEEKALQVLNLFTSEHLKELKKRIFKGGRK